VSDDGGHADEIVELPARLREVFRFAAELRARRHDDATQWSGSRVRLDTRWVLTSTGRMPVYDVRVSLRPDDGRGRVRRYFALAAVAAFLRNSSTLEVNDVVVVPCVDTMAEGDVVTVVGLSGLRWREAVIEWVAEDGADHQVAIGLPSS
jgi:hypothetical protein